jgi:membrane protein DedA with SNARE-associated domain
MVIQDVLGVLMVQSEARNHGWLAGGADSLEWLFAIATTTITVTALQGKDRRTKIMTILCVTAGNLVGSEIGVLIGQRFIR